MNNLQDLREAEQVAWANGDLKTSQLLQDAISLIEWAEQETEDAEKEIAARSSEAEDEVDNLKEFLVEVKTMIEHRI